MTPLSPAAGTGIDTSPSTGADRRQPEIRHDWTADEIEALLTLPLLDLVCRAADLHRRHNPANKVQLASLLSIKTGGCPEDCAYCPQSAHYKTGVAKEPLMARADVLAAAARARDDGASRFCMGAAWRQIKDGPEFDAVLDMVKGVRGLGMEACVTLGMVTRDQARRLKEAGLDAYNHNLDTGPDYYEKIITTRSYRDRLDTLGHVRDAGISICSGGIIGMGESWRDRAGMLEVLAAMDPHPESVPINTLVAAAGTPLEDRETIDPLDLVRMIAAARITMPKARVRLSAGRLALSREAQVLCFLAGANSIFYGEKLLTTANNADDADRALLRDIGAEALEPETDAASKARTAAE